MVLEMLRLPTVVCNYVEKHLLHSRKVDDEFCLLLSCCASRPTWSESVFEDCALDGRVPQLSERGSDVHLDDEVLVLLDAAAVTIGKTLASGLFTDVQFHFKRDDDFVETA